MHFTQNHKGMMLHKQSDNISLLVVFEERLGNHQVIKIHPVGTMNVCPVHQLLMVDGTTNTHNSMVQKPKMYVNRK